MSTIIASLVARGPRSSNVRQIAAPTFDGIVESFEPNVVSYWKFQDPIGTTVTDEEGQENATITGAPELNVPTIVKFDTIATGALTDGECIAWKGTAGDFAQAAHDAAHKTVAGTVVVYFQRDNAVQKSQLIMADSNSAAGGMAMGVTALGAPDAYIRDAAGTPVNLAGGTGDVQLDRAYALILKWGTGGMSLALWNDTGTRVRLATSVSTIGLSGISPIRFGASHTDTNNHAGPYGRVVWMNRRITDVEEQTLAQAFTIARSASSYRELELGMGPLSLWGLGEASGAVILDSVGGRNGTYAGTVLHNAPDLPEDSIDGAINFAGTGSGTVPHSTAFELAEYSLSFWFQPHTIGSASALPLVIKSSSSPIIGHMSCFLASGNNDVLRLRVRGPTINLDISSPDTAIHAGVKYHVCIRGGSTGFDLHLDGRFMGKQTGHTTGLTGNTQVWQIAWGIDFAAIGNCIIDEIALFPRVITVPEIAALAQHTDPPIAVGDAATVLEGTTEAIDIIGNDIYVGLPTIEIMANPAGGDSVDVITAANTLPFVEYTAVAVGPGGASRSFSYRITDVNGISNTVACNVAVQDSGFVSLSIANCYTHAPTGAGTTVPVNTMAELEAAIDAATPGDQITIAAGTYAGGTRTFNPQGTTANPIVVRPAGGRGSVIINDATWTLAATSARLVITNIFFNNGEININGSHHRIARCRFWDINRLAVAVMAATDTRISHCDFSDYRADSLADKGCVDFICQFVNTNALQRALLDYCYFHNIRANSNVYSNLVRCGESCGSWNNKPGIILDHCFFTDIGRVDSNEFIIVKTSEVTIRYCTFTNMNLGGIYSPEWLQQRQGRGLEVRSCWFGMPLKIFDDINVPAPVRRPLIIGNRMTGNFNISCHAGNDAPGQNGAFRPGPYHHCEDGRFIGNITENGHIQVGHNIANPPNPAGPPDYFACRDNNVNNVAGNPRRNIRNAGGLPYTLGPLEVNTTFNDNTAADNDGNSPPQFTPAEQLFPADVGMGAPDPLCPLGPQG